MNIDLKQNDAAATPDGFGVFEDFIRAGTVATGDSVTGTAISSGTLAAQATNGGWARLSGAATTDDSGYQIQSLGAHACTTGKPLVAKTRLQLNESTSTNADAQSDLYFGLFPVDTSIVASLPDNGIYFVKADGATTMACVVRVAAASTSTTLTASQFTATTGTNYSLGIGIWPNGSNSDVEFIINGVVVLRVNDVSLPADTVLLTPTIAFQTGDNTGTKWIDVDYIGSWQAR